MKYVKKLIPVMCFCWLSGCSTLHSSSNHNSQTSADPAEGLNRKIYTFNSTADKAILKPIAKAYDRAVPKPAKKGVGHFFSNLGEPLNVVNNLLQGKFDRALSSTYRFTVNSTIGLFGFFDVAKAYDVEEAPEDFGQTLASWGVKPGPYIMFPLMGPSNLRDSIGFAADAAIYTPALQLTDSSQDLTLLSALGIVNGRASLLGADEVLDSQLDPYAFLKVAYERSRLNELYDGAPPEGDEDDFDF